jgi:hypothetical protein
VYPVSFFPRNKQPTKIKYSEKRIIVEDMDRCTCTGWPVARSVQLVVELMIFIVAGNLPAVL